MLQGRGGHAAGADAAKSFTGFQARCKIGFEFQEIICFPGSWQVRVMGQEPIRP